MICGGENATDGCQLVVFSVNIAFAHCFVAPTLHPYIKPAGHLQIELHILKFEHTCIRPVPSHLEVLTTILFSYRQMVFILMMMLGQDDDHLVWNQSFVF